MKAGRISAVIVIAFIAGIFPNLFAAFGAALNQQQASEFVLLLCRDDLKLLDYVDSTELETAHRLGIEYSDVPFKFLIGQTPDSAIKAGIVEGVIRYNVKLVSLGKSYQKLMLTRQDVVGSFDYYFHDGKMILLSTYLARDWSKTESAFFQFRCSDTTLLNRYSIAELDSFVQRTARSLEFTPEQIARLRSEKIQYYLCKDPEEVAKLTGYENRGMYDLAMDRIISCYNSHYHEIAHLLVNFKLQKLPLRTHPFLQEGIAVALGGRGGLDREVIMEMAAYLTQSGTADFTDLLTNSGFNESHSTINYPVSGLYNLFLLETLGIDKYFELYRKYSGSQQELEKMAIRERELPKGVEWNRFVELFAGMHLVDVQFDSTQYELLYRGGDFRLAADSTRYLFAVRDTVLLGANSEFERYASDKFKEMFPDRVYRGEKYAIVAGSGEIKIYDLYRNELAANWVGAFRIPTEGIEKVSGRWWFTVEKGVFDEELVSPPIE